MSGYIGAHWRGEQSLARSYWVNGVLLGIPANVLQATLENIDPSQMGVTTYFTLYAAFCFILIFWGFWFAVGTIRSASRHIRETKRKFWARFAQVIAWLNIVLLPFIITANAIILWNFGQSVFGQDGFDRPSMTIVDGTTLLIEGNILFDTPKEFERLLKNNPDVDLIQIESLGGYVEPADKIVRQIHKRQLDTYSSIECTSACTHIFLAGQQRYLAHDAVMGFHSGGMTGMPDEIVEAWTNEYDWIFSERNVPTEFQKKIRSVPSDETWYPTFQELVENNIVTHIFHYNEQISYEGSEYCAFVDCTITPVVFDDNAGADMDAPQ